MQFLRERDVPLPSRWISWWLASRWVTKPVAVFAATRGFLLLLSYISLILVPMNPVAPHLRPFAPDSLWSGWLRADSISYVALAEHGYWRDATTGLDSPTLLPVLPFLSMLLSRVVGNSAVAAMLVANIAFVASLVLLYKMAAGRFGDDVAVKVILLICLFPFGLVFAVAFPQSVVLLLALLTFESLKRGVRLAAALTAVAVLTHPSGLALLPVLGLAVLRGGRKGRKRGDLLRDLFSLTVIPASIVGFGWYLWFQIGISLREILQTYFEGGRSNLVQTGLGHVGSLSLGLTGTSTVVVLLLVLGLLALAATPLISRVLGLHFALYYASVVALALASSPADFGPVVVLAFPGFLIAGYYLKSEAAETITLAISATLLALLLAAYVSWYPIGWRDRAPSDWDPKTDLASWYKAQGLMPSHELRIPVGDELLILGDDLAVARVRAGDALKLSASVHVLKATAKQYDLSLHLNDSEGRTQALIDKEVTIGRDSALFLTGEPRLSKQELSLFSTGRPNPVSKGQYVREALNMPIDASTPTGVYTLEFLVFEKSVVSPPSLLKQTVVGQIVIVNPSDVVRGSSVEMEVPIRARVGDAITLVGYDWSTMNSGADVGLRLSLYWAAQKKVDGDYTVFVHLLDASGTMVSQSDSYPVAGSYPTSRFEPGETIRDVRTLPLPARKRGEPFYVSVGMYQLESMERLPVRIIPDGSTTDQITLGPFVLSGNE